MILQLTAIQRAAFERFLAENEDSEMLSEGEWVLDLYDVDVPMSINLILLADGNLRVEGAAKLVYDESMDGWYMDARIEETESILAALLSLGALGK